MNLDARVRTNFGEADRGAEPDCARALAEAERALRELSLTAPCTHQSNPGGPSSVDEKPSEQFPVSARSGEPRVAPCSSDRIRLDPDLDFVVNDDGAIELTEAGFRRMVQAHSAGLDTVIGVDGREVFAPPGAAVWACFVQASNRGVAEMR